MLSIENSLQAIDLTSPKILTKSESLAQPITKVTSQKKRIGQYVYRLDQMIGCGYTSQVYKGYKNKKQNQLYAIKVVKLRTLSHMEYNLLKNEIKILQSLQHENVIQFHDSHFSKNHAYIITDYCQGGNLEQFLFNKKDGCLSQEEYLRIFQQIQNGCKYLAEKRIMHRDIKPANIFLKGNKWKIGDLGFARILESQDFTFNQKYIIGSPLFMPPETLASNQYSLKTDSFALGVTLFYLATKQFPWPGKTIAQILSAYQSIQFPSYKLVLLPRELQKNISRLCSLNFEERAYIQDLREFPSEQSSISEDFLKVMLIENLLKLRALNLIQKVKLSKFVIFLWENLTTQRTQIKVERIAVDGLRKMVNHIIDAIFLQKNQNLVREHFCQYEHQRHLQFIDLNEFQVFMSVFEAMNTQVIEMKEKTRTQEIFQLKIKQFLFLMQLILNGSITQIIDWIKNIVLHPDFENVSPLFIIN